METLTLANNAKSNQVLAEDRAIHDWYRFVLSFPPHLVRRYLDRFGVDAGQTVLDPFCGTGTTLVEAKKQGIPSVGIEANPAAYFAASVKTDWRVSPAGLLNHATRLGESVRRTLDEQGTPDEGHGLFSSARSCREELRSLPVERERLILRDSISPRPLHKVLALLKAIEDDPGKRYARHELLALAKAIVFSASNLHFGPEVGVGRPKRDAAVVQPWLNNVEAMAGDLKTFRGRDSTPARLCFGDARRPMALLKPASVAAVITSPPYPNEKDYTRTTRLESVLLGFIQTKADLRELKEHLIRSNTRNVFRGDDDDGWVKEHNAIQELAAQIEARRVALGKTSGFERLYARVAKLYFGGIARHLAELRPALRPGAWLAYVVGDQASYLRVMIRTAQILAELAVDLGYEVHGIELFRTRLSTVTREQLREEVLVLRWPG